MPDPGNSSDPAAGSAGGGVGWPMWPTMRWQMQACFRQHRHWPDTNRETLIAAEFEGLTLAEVAQRLGLSLSAVKTRASRGRRLLQQQLVECCRVALSANGQVLDYDMNRVAACAPAKPDAPCGRRCAKAH